MVETFDHLEPDAIVESVIGIRLHPECLPEVFLGKLLGSDVVQALNIERLPEADIPVSARENDQNLFHQPTHQLECSEYLLRIGFGHVSFHMTAPYPGWPDFFERAKAVLTPLLEGAPPATMSRFGLRYINALTADRHGVRSIEDMNLDVKIGKKKLVDLAVNFSAEGDDETETNVRIASAKHVKGELPQDTSFVVDIDVNKAVDVSTRKIDECWDWLLNARSIKNQHFFDLLPRHIVEELKAEGKS